VEEARLRKLSLRTTDAADTRQLGAVVGMALRPGDVLALTGELGAGKTVFVQGAAMALGVTERVTSPSFLLRRDYRGRVPVVHLDVYRLETFGEVADLGLDELFDGGCVTFVEWGDAVRPLLPGDHLEVELIWHDLADDERRIVLTARGDGWPLRLHDLAEGELKRWAAP
jgi:tRNA threonylcarbamoyladenosine biosynthesis protein TsaE